MNTNVGLPEGELMAKNFRISTQTSGSHTLAMQLFGDFDGSSACELIRVLDERVKPSTKVAIDTSGLKRIEAFGLVVFIPRISWLRDKCADIEFTGPFSNSFMEPKLSDCRACRRFKAGVVAL
jgi:ABC-type transporter Mla MlaB component